jgi:DNA-binding CsgD family transcriptional regulator
MKHPETPSPISSAAVTVEEVEGLTQTMALSVRERQILMLATRGLRRREISGTLGLSENTVKWYIRALLERTECRSLHDVMRKMWFARG